jgi:streptogramin lyase
MLRLLISRGLKFQAALVVLVSLVLAGPFAPRTLAQTDLFVVSNLGNVGPTDGVLLFDWPTGNFLRDFSPPRTMAEPAFMTFGPDGNLYVSNQLMGVYRFDGTTGAFLGVFTSGGPAIRFVTGLSFGPDGNLYVSDSNGYLTAGRVLRYHGLTGQFIDSFVPSGSGGLTQAIGLSFGPDGNLYVASASSPLGAAGSILRYNGLTGAFMGPFVPLGSGLIAPIGLTFGPDGNLYVSTDTASVRRYNGVTGAFIDAFVPPGSGGLQNAYHLAFGPDGNLYVSSNSTNRVLRYNGTTGAFIDTFISIKSV